MTEESLFVELLTKQSDSEREAFLQAQCGVNAPLRNRLEKLLAGHTRQNGILDGPFPARTSQANSLIGSYRLQELLGEGGFGQVFAAEQQQPVRRDVAVKLIKPGMDSREVIARFNAERQTLALMDHANIARVLEAGTTDNDRPYFVMELVRGKCITEYCDLHRLSTRERLELFLPICEAVQHAHQKGIIHRDLKPSNILVAEQDGRPSVKVIDFGVAKALAADPNGNLHQTRDTQMIGTPAYMSPEQAELGRRDVDTRTDIYSLGIVLYELLAGATPFDGEGWKSANFDEIRRIIREAEPPKPSTRIEALGPAATTISANRKSRPRELSRLFRGELDWIVMKAIDKQRDRRYATAADLGRDLRRYLANEPVEASPPSTFYRLRKFVYKRRYAVITGGAMLLLLVGGMVGTTIGMLRAQTAQAAEKQLAQGEARERIRAEKAEQEAKTRAKEAQEAAAAANKMLAFLRDDVLSLAGMETQADLGLSPQPNITIREALDRAAKRLESSFQAEPLVEAHLRQALGRSYLQLGQYEKAAGQLLVTHKIFAKQLGEGSPLALEAQVSLARANRYGGHVLAAIELHEKAREIELAKWGAEDERTLFNLHHLAESYAKAERYAEGLALQKQVYETYLRTLGPTHENTLASLQSLGGMHYAAGDLGEAVKIFEPLREVMPKTFGEHHLRTLTFLHRLSVIYWKQKQLEKSVPLMESLLPKFQKILGATHPETYLLMTNLAINYRDQGRNAEAMKLLADVHRASRNFTFLRTWSGQEWFQTCMAAGHREEAAEVLQRVIQTSRDVNRVGSQQLALELIDYADELNSVGQFDEAESMLRECLAIWQKPPVHVSNELITKSLLATSLLEHAKSLNDRAAAAAQLEEAERLFLESASGLKSLDKPTTKTQYRLGQTMESLSAYYELIGKPEQAEEWRRKKETN